MKRIFIILFIFTYHVAVLLSQEISFNVREVIGFSKSFTDRYGGKVDAESAKQYITDKYYEVIECKDSTNINYRTQLLSLCDEYINKYSPVMLPDSSMDIGLALMCSVIEDIKVSTLSSRAHIKLLDGDTRGAVDDLSEAIIIARKSPSIKDPLVLLLRNRAICYFELKEINLSCKDWREAINLGDSESKKYVKNYCQY